MDILKTAEHIKALAEKYKDARDFLYLGRGYNFPVALGRCIKTERNFLHPCRRLSCCGNETWPHRLVDENLPVVFVATKDSYHEKMVSNMQEIKARKGKVIAVITEGDEMSFQLSDDVIVSTCSR